MNAFEYWQSPRFWPVVSADDKATFLADAMNLLGKAAYGDKWTGREAWIDTATLYPMLCLPESLANATALQQQTGRLLLSLGDGISLRKITRFEILEAPVAPQVQQAPLSTAEWEKAIEAAQATWTVFREASIRWDELCEGTALAFRTGQLKATLRDKAGEYEEPPQGSWKPDLQYVRARFAFCQIDLDHLVDQPLLGNPLSMPARFRQIFVRTPTLKALLAQIRDARTREVLASGERPQLEATRRPAHNAYPSDPERVAAILDAISSGTTAYAAADKFACEMATTKAGEVDETARRTHRRRLLGKVKKKKDSLAT